MLLTGSRGRATGPRSRNPPTSVSAPAGAIRRSSPCDETRATHRAPPAARGLDVAARLHDERRASPVEPDTEEGAGAQHEEIAISPAVGSAMMQHAHAFGTVEACAELPAGRGCRRAGTRCCRRHTRGPRLPREPGARKIDAGLTRAVRIGRGHRRGCRPGPARHQPSSGSLDIAGRMRKLAHQRGAPSISGRRARCAHADRDGPPYIAWTDSGRVGDGGDLGNLLARSRRSSTTLGARRRGWPEHRGRRSVSDRRVVRPDISAEPAACSASEAMARPPAARVRRRPPPSAARAACARARRRGSATCAGIRAAGDRRREPAGRRSPGQPTTSWLAAPHRRHPSPHLVGIGFEQQRPADARWAGPCGRVRGRRRGPCAPAHRAARRRAPGDRPTWRRRSGRRRNARRRSWNSDWRSNLAFARWTTPYSTPLATRFDPHPNRPLDFSRCAPRSAPC